MLSLGHVAKYTFLSKFIYGLENMKQCWCFLSVQHINIAKIAAQRKPQIFLVYAFQFPIHLLFKSIGCLFDILKMPYFGIIFCKIMRCWYTKYSITRSTQNISPNTTSTPQFSVLYYMLGTKLLMA